MSMPTEEQPPRFVNGGYVGQRHEDEVSSCLLGSLKASGAYRNIRIIPSGKYHEYNALN